jgi:hypothetical protein
MRTQRKNLPVLNVSEEEITDAPKLPPLIKCPRSIVV